MAKSPAVTMMTIFMMLIPLCWAPGRADRVTPLFRFVCARRPLLPFHVPAQSPGGMAPDYLSLWRWIGSNANGRIGRTQINQMVIGRQRCRSPGSLPPSFYRSALGYAYLTTADASRYPRTLLREG